MKNPRRLQPVAIHSTTEEFQLLLKPHPRPLHSNSEENFQQVDCKGRVVRLVDTDPARYVVGDVVGL